jgi:hypothetical protein
MHNLETKGLTGDFEVINDTIRGKFVEFDYSNEMGEISNYSVNTNCGMGDPFRPMFPMIDSFHATGLENGSGAIISDNFGIVSPRTRTPELYITNNPSAEFTYAVHNGENVSLKAATGINITSTPTKEYRSYPGNLSGLYYEYNRTVFRLERSSPRIEALLCINCENFTVSMPDNSTINILIHGEGNIYCYVVPNHDPEIDRSERQLSGLIENGSIGVNIRVGSYGDHHGYSGYYHRDYSDFDGCYYSAVQDVALQDGAESVNGKVWGYSEWMKVIVLSIDNQTIDPQRAQVSLSGNVLNKVNLDDLIDHVRNNNTDPVYATLYYPYGVSNTSYVTRYIIYLPQAATLYNYTIENKAPNPLDPSNSAHLFAPVALVVWTAAWSVTILFIHWHRRKKSVDRQVNTTHTTTVKTTDGEGVLESKYWHLSTCTSLITNDRNYCLFFEVFNAITLLYLAVSLARILPQTMLENGAGVFVASSKEVVVSDLQFSATICTAILALLVALVTFTFSNNKRKPTIISTNRRRMRWNGSLFNNQILKHHNAEKKPILLDKLILIMSLLVFLTATLQSYVNILGMATDDAIPDAGSLVQMADVIYLIVLGLILFAIGGAIVAYNHIFCQLELKSKQNIWLLNGMIFVGQYILSTIILISTLLIATVG